MTRQATGSPLSALLGGAGAWRTPITAGVAVLAGAVVAAVWAPDMGRLLSRDDEAVPREAARWVEANVPEGPILVDAAQ